MRSFVKFLIKGQNRILSEKLEQVSEIIFARITTKLRKKCKEREKKRKKEDMLKEFKSSSS